MTTPSIAPSIDELASLTKHERKVLGLVCRATCIKRAHGWMAAGVKVSDGVAEKLRQRGAVRIETIRGTMHLVPTGMGRMAHGVLEARRRKS